MSRYFRKVLYAHLQQFQSSSDNCGKMHVRIFLGHPIKVAQSGAHPRGGPWGGGGAIPHGQLAAAGSGRAAPAEPARAPVCVRRASDWPG